MNIGSFAITWATMPLVLAMAGYFMVAVGVKEFRISARVTYWILLGLAAISFIDLFQLFISDKFQFSYVASYSSKDLANTWPHFYKFSALWAGQQGTFLLWLIFGLVLGLWVRWKAKDDEGWVMFFYLLSQVFLLVLTLVSNPFARLDFIPKDGQGLNPLLQNYWMQIHPPIVFLGFAAACIPFAFAMAALARNKYDDWVKQTMPWVVFTVVTLGLGIFLGGYWAYETLGWGGYWSWDPVENASIIPWLVGVALVHGMVVEKARGSWRRMNLFLAIALFLLIVYGTFLTRSGVLADFSVHSFVDLGYNNFLWASMIILAVVSLGLFAIRASKIKGTPPGTDVLSQEFATFLGVALLLPFTALILFWTSFPLITTIFSKIPLLSKITPAPAAINTSYYNVAGLIFAAIFAIILGYNSLLFWRKTDSQDVFRKLLLPLILGIIGGLLFVTLGFAKIIESWSPAGTSSISFKIILIALLYFLFSSAALFAFISNLMQLIRRRNTSLITLGGYLAHIGFAMMLIGIILSSGFGNKTKITISEGDSKAGLGYNVKYVGTEKTAAKEETSNFELYKGSEVIKAYSVSKEMRRGNDLQYVRTPYIKKGIVSDLYLSLENISDQNEMDLQPVEIKVGDSTLTHGYKIIFTGFDSEENLAKLRSSQPQIFDLVKGTSLDFIGRKITFEKFDMGQHQAGQTSSIGAVLTVDYNGKTSTLTPTYEPLSSGEHNAPPVDFPGGGTISLVAIKADIKAISLSYSSDQEIPKVTIGASMKVWSGNAHTSNRMVDSATVKMAYDPSSMHGAHSIAPLPDGGQLFLLGVNAVEHSASLLVLPPQQPQLATIEISTKPLINLVWLGFTIICIGAAIATIRRMREGRN